MFYVYTFVYMCAYKPVSMYVYVYFIHKHYIFTCMCAFIYTDIKDGGRFLFFS